MVLTYIGLGVLSGAAIAATWHIMSTQYRSVTYEPERLEWWWGPPGIGKTYAAGRPECDVCGQWTVGLTCFECVAWAEKLICDAFFLDATTVYEQYDGRMWPHEIEHRRLVKKVGW